MRIVITGGTGFVGSVLVARLREAGHSPVVLSRDGERAAEKLGTETHTWNYAEDPVPAGAMAGAEAIVHLMGENIGEGRWTESRKRRMHDSRVVSARKLIETMPDSVGVFVSASAIGYYPGEGDTVYDESYTAPETDDFMQQLTVEWERAAAEAAERGVRTSIHRFGIVLGEEGMLAQLLPLFRLGLGGPVGDGRQWLPWVHVIDVVRALEAALGDERYAGPINTMAPEPVRYEEFADTLAEIVHRPSFLRVPAIALKLGLGEASALALRSYRVVPRRLTEELGFEFSYPKLRPALEDAVRRTA
jgi:hypothetical protein